MRTRGVKQAVAAGWPGRAWGLVESKGGLLRLSLPEGEAGKFLMRLNLVLIRSLRAAGQLFNWSAVELYFDRLAVGAGPPVRPGRAANMRVRWRTSSGIASPSGMVSLGYGGDRVGREIPLDMQIITCDGRLGANAGADQCGALWCYFFQHLRRAQLRKVWRIKLKAHGFRWMTQPHGKSHCN